MTSRETDAAWDIHSCGYHCEKPACMKAQRLELLSKLAVAELDSKRLEWIKAQFFTSHWNGVVDSGSRTTWQVAGNYRHTAFKMTTSDFEPDFRAAITAAIAQQKETK